MRTPRCSAARRPGTRSCLSSDEEKLRAYADPAVRAKLHEEMVEWKVEIPGGTISREWYKYIWVEEPKLDKNKPG